MSPFFKNFGDRFLTIAHRGASSLAPENTLSAAQKALQVGADMWELDVQMSADGKLIILHDETLSRTSNVKDLPKYGTRWPWNPHQFTLAELKELDAGSWYVAADPFGQIHKGAVSQEDALRYREEKILSLAEALNFTKRNDYRVNVEIKDLSDSPGNETIVGKLADCVVKRGMVEQVLVSSFNHEYLMKLKIENPAISTAALVRKAPPNPVDTLKRLNADALHVSRKIVTPEIIKQVCDAGYFVNVFTVNDEKTRHQLKTAGASGIITDFPQMCAHPLSG
jgi:glycerophosphoryl diester phosphodiesterase